MKLNFIIIVKIINQQKPEGISVPDKTYLKPLSFDWQSDDQKVSASLIFLGMIFQTC